MAALRAVLVAALVAAAGVGVGIGIGAAIWEGSSSSSAAEPAAAPGTYDKAASWLFVATAESGVVMATGDDALTILLRGAAPQSLGFTDRPARQAEALNTSTLWPGLYAGGSAPPNGALSFEHEGAAVLVPFEMLSVTGAAPDYTIAARALGEGGVAHLGAAMVQGGVVVRGAGDPLWPAMRAGLAVEAPTLFVDSFWGCVGCTACVGVSCVVGCIEAYYECGFICDGCF